MVSSDETVFEPDSETLGPAAYYVTRQQRWAVSNVGYPAGHHDTTPQDKIKDIGTPFYLDDEMFRTARLSAGSLRYYGLGLLNGRYNLSLYFVEGQIDNSQNWRSFGRRVFDIYIQGKLAWKDFDIRKEAGDLYKTVVMNFTAMVTQNYLEIHLVWVGKGTFNVPYQGVFGPSISAISAQRGEFISTGGYSKNRAGMIVGIIIPVGVVFLILLFAIFCVQRRRQRRRVDEVKHMKCRILTLT